MMRFKFLILLTLPILSFGQGFILEKTFDLPIDASSIDEIQPVHSLNGFNFVVLADSIYLMSLDSEKLKYQSIKTKVEPLDFNSNSAITYQDYFIYFYSGQLLFYDITKERTIKSLSLSKKYRQVPWYVFQDELYIYVISYYNNNDRNNLGHDFLYLHKISKRKKKRILSKELNIGPEIVLSPLNHQLVAFNQNKFYICSSVTSQIITLDKNFLPLDTTYIDTSLAAENFQVFDSLFPQNNISFYLFNPRDLIYHYTNSAMNEISSVTKLFALNDSILQVTIRLQHRELYKSVLYNINSKSVLMESTIPFRNNKFSTFCWTRFIYPNNNQQFGIFNLDYASDTSAIYQGKIYSFNYNAPIKTNSLDDIKFYKSKDSKSKLTSFSGVILADDYFCKGCYSDYGSGDGVLVIKSYDFLNEARLNIDKKFLMRSWHITGDIWFVDSVTYQKLLEKFNPNILYPLVPNE